MSLKTAALVSTMSSGLLSTLPWCTTSCSRRGGGLVISWRMASVLQALVGPERLSALVYPSRAGGGAGRWAMRFVRVVVDLRVLDGVLLHVG
eukprot:3695636-Pyramimonas_sp.AAC.1